MLHIPQFNGNHDMAFGCNDYIDTNLYGIGSSVTSID